MQRQDARDTTVVEILPCPPGWRAVLYVPVDDRHELARHHDRWETEVAAWYVIRDAHDAKPRLHPVVALNGEICDATEIHNFMGVIPPGAGSDAIPDAIAHAIEARIANKMYGAAAPDDLTQLAARGQS